MASCARTCGHDRCCQLNSRKLQQCNRCHRQTSITAGTIFDSTKLPLTVWFQAIYLMTQDKKGISAMKLHRHLGISYNAAWRIGRLRQLGPLTDDNLLIFRDRTPKGRHYTERPGDPPTGLQDSSFGAGCFGNAKSS